MSSNFSTGIVFNLYKFRLYIMILFEEMPMKHTIHRNMCDSIFLFFYWFSYHVYHCILLVPIFSENTSEYMFLNLLIASSAFSVIFINVIVCVVNYINIFYISSKFEIVYTFILKFTEWMIIVYHILELWIFPYNGFYPLRYKFSYVMLELRFACLIKAFHNSCNDSFIVFFLIAFSTQFIHNNIQKSS